MAAYLYRMTFKALVITSVLIFACQLAAVVAAAPAVPADHSSAPVIGCNMKGSTPVYGKSSLYRRTRRQPKPELLNHTRDPEPDNKRNVRGPRRRISFGGLTELKAACQIPGRNRRQDHRGELCAKGKEDIAVTTNGRRTWQRSVFGSSPELLREPQALLRDQDQGEQKRLLGCGIFSGIVASQK
ncbi:hypothetical protein Gotur_004931 [Gossypium turneri]